jgi:hypothetical protein
MASLLESSHPVLHEAVVQSSPQRRCPMVDSASDTSDTSLHGEVSSIRYGSHAEADVRPGGRFSVVFRLLNGEEHNPTGVYQEVVPETKLVFTWEWPEMPERESLVTFLLEPVDGGTELTLIHEHLPAEEARKSHEEGWTDLLDKLPVFLGDLEWAT